ncbi:hypothetical protein Adt_42031 [Abeliophyllum distichum]|uniref:DUF6821 domain-containing protein n=1 Tax=Abeliophyllum distichum TaxID=126358 RepID=A0ABD1PQN0_9LAMI
MDTVQATNEIQDWEVLHLNSDFESADSVNTFEDFESDGVIQTNYFSLDSQNLYLPANGEDFDDNKSAHSNNPSWIDPGSEDNSTRYVNKEPDKYWSDSSSDRSDYRKFNDFEGKTDMGFLKYEEKQVLSQGIEETVQEKETNMENLEKFYADSGGMEVTSTNSNGSQNNSEVGIESTNAQDRSAVLSKDKCENKAIGNEMDGIDGNGINGSGEIEKRGVAWWKMPVELLKYCIFRASPLWTVSMAAAVMGFLILGRRLYKMKKKTRGLEIKVTIDDKKVSQFMSRAARLNEAFSVVKRVPVVRPSLPAVGISFHTRCADGNFVSELMEAADIRREKYGSLLSWNAAFPQTS